MSDGRIRDTVAAVNRSLSDADPVCACDICSSPVFAFCPVGRAALAGRLQYVMDELDSARECGGQGG